MKGPKKAIGKFVALKAGNGINSRSRKYQNIPDGAVLICARLPVEHAISPNSACKRDSFTVVFGIWILLSYATIFVIYTKRIV